MVNTMKGMSMSDEKMAYLNKSVGNDTRVFTGAQLVSVLSVLDFTDDKVSVRPSPLYRHKRARQLKSAAIALSRSIRTTNTN
jgi:hypothetical protein